MGILPGRAICLVQEPAELTTLRSECAMADDDKPNKNKTPVTPPRSKMKSPEERPFDLWLHKQLHAMYDEIASEPLPNDLLNLIDQDAAKKTPKDSGDK